MKKLRQLMLIISSLLATSSPIAQTPDSPALTSLPISATVTTANPVPKPAVWGQGVLEAEFLTKLRLFLERDPLDYKVLGRLFGLKLEASPIDAPYPDGSWGINPVGRVPYPFGQARGPHNSSFGYSGPTYSFIPSRDTKYLRLELLKPPINRWLPESKWPCIQLSDFPKTFAPPAWKRTQVLREDKGVDHFESDEYRYSDPHGHVVLVYINPRVNTCVGSILVTLPVMPQHPAQKIN